MGHTQGPWEYKTTPGSDHEYCTVYVRNGKAIARHVEPDNARLIAAAPDLLEAGEKLVAWLHRLANDSEAYKADAAAANFRATAKDMEQAIKKAGERFIKNGETQIR